MKRVLNHAYSKVLFIFISLLAIGHSALATTAIIPSDDEMVIAARAIVRGKVVSVETALDNENRIFTYITLKVREVLKGEITERRIVIKEPGGEIGNRGSLVFGTPQFARGDRVLLYLDTWRDGSLRVLHMFLGQFSIVPNNGSDELVVTRNVPDNGVSILGQSNRGTITNRMELTQYTKMVRNRVAATVEFSREFEAEAYGDTPVLEHPAEYPPSTGGDGDLSPQFHLWNPPTRWFQPDTGQSVVFKTNPDGAPNAQSVNDAIAAMNAWSTVPGCSLRVDNGGTTEGCGLFTLDGENTISFNNCDNYFHGTGTCSSGILAVASIANYNPGQTIVVNGVSFARALESNISFNPFSACNFANHCNVQEITTHEMGHALGLHHSWDPTFPGSPSAADQAATMYYIAHFDGRCASLRPDDVNGITFIYPGSGGGPGPLTVNTSSLAGGTVGAAYSQSLSASGGTLPYTWSLVPGLGTLPAGLTLSGSGVISGTPTTAATSNFTVRVTDQPGTTAQRALSIVVSASGGGGALNSQFVTQNVPTNVQPGQVFVSNLQFRNTGTTTWSGAAYFFASQNPTLNQTWGGNGVSLNGFVATPGQTLSVDFTATAPTTPGTYNFQWQMYQNGGAGFFGQMSTNVAIQVGNAPPTSGPQTIGLYSSNNAEFLLRNSNSTGPANLSFFYGPAALGWMPLAGDWNGDGVTSIGLYNPATSTFFLKNSNASGPADLVFIYGPAGLGWVPLVGDWNGDGVDTVGLYNPATAMFFLKNSHAAGLADLVFPYGPAGLGWLPVVGDWNGDGVDTIGLYNPATSTFFLKNSNAAGAGDLVFGYGPAGAGWKPLIGDWNADGTDTIGLYEPTMSTFFLKNSNAAGPGDLVFTYQAQGNNPVSGKWN
jgi:putative Ig domain-containing protein/Ig-like domain-containing protein/matrixin